MNGMKLRRLLEAHDSGQPSEGLALNLGDGYLCEKNQIFRQIRKHALKNGFRYSTEFDRDYLALPLSQLNALLTKKQLPYFDNVSVLKKINSQVHSELNWDDVSDNLKRNYLFHESCHAVARSCFHETQESKSPEHLLRILLEESFANTCELLAVVDVNDPAHRLFYEWNSYTCLIQERVSLNKALEEMGGANLFKYFLFCYLHSNFLKDGLTDSSFQRLVKMVFKDKSLDPKKLKTLRALAKIAFTLDWRFRKVTTGLHLRLCGFQEAFPQLLDFDFMEVLETRSHLQNSIEKLTAAVEL